MKPYTARELMQAHQYLYYVVACPVWSDFSYDKFCERHGLDGNGGSDRDSDYSDKVKDLANDIHLYPGQYPSDMSLK